jgi:hypothetical protein
VLSKYVQLFKLPCFLARSVSNRNIWETVKSSAASRRDLRFHFRCGTITDLQMAVKVFTQREWE